jgi:hypothetical protein
MTLRITRTVLALALATPGLAGCGGGSHDSATTASSTTSMGSTPRTSRGAGSMAGMNMGAMDGDGTSATVSGYSLVKVTNPAKAGKAGQISFVIDGPSGKPQTDFTLQQTKLLHLYVVRNDLTGFQHIHPNLDVKTGLWTVPVTFAKPGPYRMVIEFEALTADGTFDDRILGTNFTVGGAKYVPAPYTPVTGKTSVDGYDVSLDETSTINGPPLHLNITKGGVPVTDLQPYLESFAHVTGFREGDLKAVHVHPTEGPKKGDLSARGGPLLTLASVFTAVGKYRMFIEFQDAGQVHLTSLDVQVS